MPGLGQRLLGAAVAGAGATIVENARNRREETLLRLRRDWQVQDRADSAALTREGWDRADARAAEGRAHDIALIGAKAAAKPDDPGDFHNLYDPKTEAIVSARKGSSEEAELIFKGYEAGRPHKPDHGRQAGGPAKAAGGLPQHVQMEDGTFALEAHTRRPRRYQGEGSSKRRKLGARNRRSAKPASLPRISKPSRTS